MGLHPASAPVTHKKTPPSTRKSFCAAGREELEAIERIHRGHYARMPSYSVYAEDRYTREPNEHYWTEGSSNFPSPEGLQYEKCKKDRD